ncbi:MAG: hypothetical protein AAF383_17990 [Cyanobacteria bacterium P01_A01_bin.83]
MRSEAQPLSGQARRGCAIVSEGDWGSSASRPSGALGVSPVR